MEVSWSMLWSTFLICTLLMSLVANLIHVCACWKQWPLYFLLRYSILLPFANALRIIYFISFYYSDRWRGFNYRYKPVDRVQIERKLQNKVASCKGIISGSFIVFISKNGYWTFHCSVLIAQERTLEEQNKFVENIMKRDLKRQKRIEAAGIEYECPEIVSTTPLS